MSAATRTLVTLLVLGGVLVVAALWGFRAATEPFPGKADAAVCVDRSIAQGDKVFANEVTVSVDNAGSRNGLASLTIDLLTEAGFAEGDTGNAPKGTEVPFVQIWTSEPDNPAVQMVHSWLGRGSHVVERSESAPGVLVVVGDRFNDLVKGKKKLVARGDATICSPPID